MIPFIIYIVLAWIISGVILGILATYVAKDKFTLEFLTICMLLGGLLVGLYWFYESKDTVIFDFTKRRK
jgi:hypothetical protein